MSKHDSVTIPTGRFASTTCRFVNRFARDSGTAQKVAGARSLTPVLPLDVADLTAEWFGAVLERDVTGMELLDLSSGTTGRAHVALTGDPSVPPTVFVKLAPFDERQREFVTSVGMGVAEARFYRDLAPEIPVRIPGVWFADTDGDGYVMVLEDLVAGGCRFPHPADDDIGWRARHRRADGGTALPILGVAPLRRRRRSRVARAEGHGRRGWRRDVREDGGRRGRRPPAPGVPPSGRHLPRAQRRHRAAVELRSPHARARRPPSRQSLRRHRRGRPHRLPRLGDARPLARPARRRVRLVQLDSGRGPRGRRARSSSAIARCSPWPGSTSTPRSRGSSTASSRSTRGCRRRRPPAWDRSGSLCTSAWAARDVLPRRARNSAASTCWSDSSRERLRTNG